MGFHGYSDQQQQPNAFSRKCAGLRQREKMRLRFGRTRAGSTTAAFSVHFTGGAKGSGESDGLPAD
jgi:hypothetical protein